MNLCSLRFAPLCFAVLLTGCLGTGPPATPPSAPVYTILEITVQDDDAYQRYREAVAPIIAAHGGCSPVRSGVARIDPDPKAAIVSPEGD